MHTGRAIISLSWGRLDGSRLSMLRMSCRSSGLYRSEIGANVPLMIFRTSAGRFWKQSKVKIAFCIKNVRKIPNPLPKISAKGIIFSHYYPTAEICSELFICVEIKSPSNLLLSYTWDNLRSLYQILWEITRIHLSWCAYSSSDVCEIF